MTIFLNIHIYIYTYIYIYVRSLILIFLVTGWFDYVHRVIDESTLCREECACNPVLFFCIVSMQRSGSGWFETFLNSHINVSSKGEIFSVGKRRANVSSILETMDKVYIILIGFLVLPRMSALRLLASS